MIDHFKRYLKKDRKSLTTIVSYIRTVEEYLEWYKMYESINFSCMKKQDIDQYRSYLRDKKGYKEESVNVKVSAVIKFNEFLIHNNL